MADRPLAETQLDEAIDRAVREMMNVEPPGRSPRPRPRRDSADRRPALSPWPRLAVRDRWRSPQRAILALLPVRASVPPDRAVAGHCRRSATTSACRRPGGEPVAGTAARSVRETRPITTAGQSTDTLARKPACEDTARSEPHRSTRPTRWPQTRRPRSTACRQIEPIRISRLEDTPVSTSADRHRDRSRSNALRLRH